MVLSKEEIHQFILLKDDPDIRLDEVIQDHYAIQMNRTVSMSEIKEDLDGIDHMIAASAAVMDSQTEKRDRGWIKEDNDENQA